MRHNLRSSLTGKYISSRSVISKSKPSTIRPGSLYGYKGAVVRAGQPVPNGMRHVSFHKQLHGFVPEADLRLIPVEKVEEYLSNVKG
jgi:hypothetical protein